VEDDKAARLAITRILTRRGFAVCDVGCLADAMQSLTQRPDWVLLDLMLPDGCGIHLLRKIQRDGLGSKVCIVSGCGSELLQEASQAGAAHTFTKPVDVERLVHVLGA
jgi:DNA-binding NtrC family response regulator